MRFITTFCAAAIALAVFSFAGVPTADAQRYDPNDQGDEWEQPDNRDQYDRRWRDPERRDQYDFRNMEELFFNRGNRVVRECRPFMVVDLDIGRNQFNNPVEGRPDQVRAANMRLFLVNSIKRNNHFFCQYALPGEHRQIAMQYRLRCKGAKRHRSRDHRYRCKRG